MALQFFFQEAIAKMGETQGDLHFENEFSSFSS